MNHSRLIVTGATGSIGSALASALLAEGKPVILACRNLEKGIRLQNALHAQFPDALIEVRKLELESLDSIEAFATQLQSDGVVIEALFNNAGIMPRRYNVTPDGFEQSLGVNYIAPYLLCRRLIPLFAPNGVIINTTSLTRNFVRIKESLFTRNPQKYTQLGWYAQSKRAVFYLTATLVRRYPDLRIHAMDPGVVDTGIIKMDRWFDPLADWLFRPIIKRPEQGALPALNAYRSTSSGSLYSGNGSKVIPQKNIESPLGNWLWEESERQLTRRGICF